MNNVEKTMRTILVSLLLACALLQGCATSSVVVGKTRPPISADAVKIYLTAPAKFEEVALLESSSRGAFAITDQGKMDSVISRMKEEAARLGANGILIRSTGDASGGFAGTTIKTGPNSSMFVGGQALIKAGSGIAIFVVTE